MASKGVMLDYDQERLAKRKDERGAGRLAKWKAVSQAGRLTQGRGRGEEQDGCKKGKVIR